MCKNAMYNQYPSQMCMALSLYNYLPSGNALGAEGPVHPPKPPTFQQVSGYAEGVVINTNTNNINSDTISTTIHFTGL